MISPGEFVQANDVWVNDRKHGPQFKAQYLRAAAPTTAEGIKKYLASGMIKGIGPVYGGQLLEIPEEVLRPAPTLEIDAGSVIADRVGERTCVFLAGLHRAEWMIASRLDELSRARRPWSDIDPERAISWVEPRTGLTFANSQRAAIELALRSKVLVITGSPGVGKTTLVNAILKILGAKDVEIALAAPTGRAAKRLTETTDLEAKTIHRLLETDPNTGGFKRGEDNPIEGDLLVIDETSMVDVPLMHALLKAVDDASALILVGDVDQLPSVGPGQVLADIIGSGAVPVVRLTEVFRQATASRIITNAHRINQGRMPDLERPDGRSDFYFVAAKDPEDGSIRSSISSRSVCPSVSGWIRCATSNCSAR